MNKNDRSKPVLFDMLPDHFPSIGKLKDAAGDALYQAVMFGVTERTIVDTKAVVGAVVIGVLSALAVGYINGEKMSVRLEATIQRLDQANREQAEFRAEFKSGMAQRSAEYQALIVKQAEIDATIRMIHRGEEGMSGMSGMSGINGRVRK